MNIINFEGRQIRREAKPVPISDQELEHLRMQAEFQALGDPRPHWRNLVRALAELQRTRKLWEIVDENRLGVYDNTAALVYVRGDVTA
jgi:hypothetical protein